MMRFIPIVFAIAMLGGCANMSPTERSLSLQTTSILLAVTDDPPREPTDEQVRRWVDTAIEVAGERFADDPDALVASVMALEAAYTVWMRRGEDLDWRDALQVVLETMDKAMEVDDG